MPITPEIRRFLQTSGFTNYCFVSYAYTGENPMAEFARRIQAEVEMELKTQVPNPQVFLNTIHIPPGNPWPDEIKDNLAGSLTMVAILSQVYFAEEHAWCNIEWTAMDKLRKERYPRNGVYPTIPVLYRKPVLPTGVELRQYIDLTRSQIAGRRFYARQEFREAIAEIIKKIEDVAEATYQSQCKAQAAGFIWPSPAPFVVPVQPLPLGARGKRKKAPLAGKGTGA